MEKTTFEKKQQCTECCFSDRMVKNGGMKDGEVIGNFVTICRRNPPIVAYQFIPISPTQGHIMAESMWPQMQIGDWCGKFEAKQH